MKNELCSPATVEISPTSYLEERVDFKIDLYKRLSRKQRNLYYLVSSLAIILAASAPVAVNVADGKLIPTVAGLLVTILFGLEKLFLFREHWKNYDLAEESLLKEKYLFQSKAGPYAEIGDEESFRLFVENFEARINEERTETIEARTRRLDQSGA